MRLLLVCCLTVFGAFATLAAADSAKDFLKKCDLPKPQDSKGANYNYGYCLGRISIFIGIGPYLIQEHRFCPPAEIPIMGIGTLARYLKEHPEHQELPAVAVMLVAYQKEWPCK